MIHDLVSEISSYFRHQDHSLGDFLSEIGGALLLILLLATLYQQAYRKWFASPEL